MRTRAQAGFTLIELMSTLLVLAIIFGVAVPGFQVFIANQKLRNASFDLFTSLNLARSEATKRGTDVTVVAVNPPDWSQGWKVMVGTPGTPGPDVMARDPLNADVVVAEAAALTSVTYKSNGRLVPGVVPSFTFTSLGQSGATKRCLAVDTSGKAVAGC